MKDFLFNEESGQGMVEYGLILALVAVVAIAVLVILGKRVNGTFAKANNALADAGVGGAETAAPTT